MKFSNAAMWNALREKFPSFKSMTAKATADFFTERGWGELSRNNLPALNSFYELSMRVAFQKIDIAKVKTRLKEVGLVETYGEENGNYLQRISMEVIKPLSPAYRNLQNGSSVDPFVVRKPEAKERFFQRNSDYASGITIQDFQLKNIFLNEYGMSSFIGGIMAGLENGYKEQMELNVYQCLHEAINSLAKPLQDTQKLTLTSWTDGAVTEAELLDFITQLQDLATAMDTSITQKGFNANAFETAVDKEDHVVLVRAGIMNAIKRMKALNVHYGEGADMLEIPFKVVEVQDFGGLEYYFGDPDSGYKLYPHYDTLGAVDGWALSAGGDKEKELDDPSITIVDTDADILAVVAQKGVIFENIANPYSVEPIRNPRGLYNNYWASAPDNTIAYDANYDLITISKPSA